MQLIDKIIQTLSGDFFSIGSMINVSAAGIVTEQDKFFTQEGVAKVYQINQMKAIYPDDLISTIISKLTKLDSSLNIKSYFEVESCYVSVNTPQFTAKMNRSIADYLQFKTEFEKLPVEIQESGIYQDNGVRRWSFTKKDIARKKHRYDSFTDVSNHVRNDAGVYYLVSIFITITFTSIEVMNALSPQILAILRKEAVTVTPIDKRVATLMANYSPTVTNAGEFSVSQMLCSEENLTQLIPFRKEGILSSRGIPIGTNIRNNTPFWMDLFSSPEGSSTLIIAKAGKGKSFIGFNFTTQFVGAGNTAVYIDIKGTEVVECMENVMDSVKAIDFSSKSSPTINTMHLNKLILLYTLDDAVKVTSELLSIFVNINEATEGNQEDVLRILRHAVRSYYNDLHITNDNHDTWYRSEEMTYPALLNYISDQIASYGTDKPKLKELASTIADRLGEAFITYNMQGNQNLINFEELFGYGTIIFSFNKNTDVSFSLIDKVRIYMVLVITKRLAKFNKTNGIFTNVICEEAQRYVHMPVLSQGISDLASGSRSDNLSVTCIMNDAKILKVPELSSLRSNIQNFIIGACDNETVTILRDVFLKHQLADDVAEIIKNPKKYPRVFAAHYESGSSEINAMIRCDTHPEIAEKFKTRTIKVEESAVI